MVIPQELFENPKEKPEHLTIQIGLTGELHIGPVNLIWGATTTSTSRLPPAQAPVSSFSLPSNRPASSYNYKSCFPDGCFQYHFNLQSPL